MVFVSIPKAQVQETRFFVKEIDFENNVFHGVFKHGGKSYEVTVVMRTGFVPVDAVEETIEELLRERLVDERMNIVPEKINYYTNYTVDCSKPSRFSDKIICVVD